MGNLAQLRVKRAATPKPLGCLRIKDSRPAEYALHSYAYYWPNGCLTVGVVQRPEEGRPVPYEAWHILHVWYTQNGEEPLPMATLQELVAEAVRASWEGAGDLEYALTIFRRWQEQKTHLHRVVQVGEVRVVYYKQRAKHA